MYRIAVIISGDHIDPVVPQRMKNSSLRKRLRHAGSIGTKEHQLLASLSGRASGFPITGRQPMLLSSFRSVRIFNEAIVPDKNTIESTSCKWVRVNTAAKAAYVGMRR